MKTDAATPAIAALTLLAASAAAAQADAPQIRDAQRARNAAGQQLVIPALPPALSQALRDALTGTGAPAARSAPSSAPGSRARPHRPPAAPAGFRYFVTDLGTLGGSSSFAYDINERGEVLGYSWLAGDSAGHTFFYSAGRMIDLAPLNSVDIVAMEHGLNARGEVASGMVVDGIYQPAIHDVHSGRTTLLGSLGGVTSWGFSGVAADINEAGAAVGHSYVNEFDRHAFLYADGQMRDIDPFGGFSQASAINERGTVVGFGTQTADGFARAFVYRNGSAMAIGPVGDDTWSSAHDVNDHDEVVGEFGSFELGATHAFLFSGGVFRDIGPKEGDSVAYAVNNRSQVVGIRKPACFDPGTGGPWVCPDYRGFLYERGRMLDLETLIPSAAGWTLDWAFDINDAGQIVGYGKHGEAFRAFLLTPAREPKQCMRGAWKGYGFATQGRCMRFVLTGR